MSFLLRGLSYCGLVLSIVPALFVMAGKLDRGTYYQLMTAGMLLWFGAGVFWIKRDKTEG